MPYEIDPKDERIFQFLKQDCIGNLTIHGKLEAADLTAVGLGQDN